MPQLCAGFAGGNESCITVEVINKAEQELYESFKKIGQDAASGVRRATSQLGQLN